MSNNICVVWIAVLIMWLFQDIINNLHPVVPDIYQLLTTDYWLLTTHACHGHVTMTGSEVHTASLVHTHCILVFSVTVYMCVFIIESLQHRQHGKSADIILVLAGVSWWPLEQNSSVVSPHCVMTVVLLTAIVSWSWLLMCTQDPNSLLFYIIESVLRIGDILLICCVLINERLESGPEKRRN